jgi:hypothetical protein
VCAPHLQALIGAVGDAAAHPKVALALALALARKGQQPPPLRDWLHRAQT